ncbi:MAG: hypothetical protein H0W25_03385, partial [Acidimicrobiia bacterium]|nr:hypothetical protein [Acidimicrobiia bacterium]
MTATAELARVELVVGLAHERWMGLLAAVDGNPLGVATARFGPDGHIVASRVAGQADVQWMQHVHGVLPGDVDGVAEILAWCAAAGCTPRFELAPADGFGPLAAALTAAGLGHRTFTELAVAPAALSVAALVDDVVVDLLPPVPSEELTT